MGFIMGFGKGFADQSNDIIEQTGKDRQRVLDDRMKDYREFIKQRENQLEQTAMRKRQSKIVAANGSMSGDVAEAYLGAGIELPELLNGTYSMRGQSPGQPPSAPGLGQPSPQPAAQPGGRPIGIPEALLPHYQAASQRYGVPLHVIGGVHKNESNFNPNAIGGAGEWGLGQILPATAAKPGFGLPPISREEAMDPAKNIDWSTRYLAARAGANVNWNDPNTRAAALARYNGGGDPNYVSKVEKYIAMLTPQQQREARQIVAQQQPAPMLPKPTGGAPAGETPISLQANLQNMRTVPGEDIIGRGSPFITEPPRQGVAAQMNKLLFGGNPREGVDAQVRQEFAASRGLDTDQLAQLEQRPEPPPELQPNTTQYSPLNSPQARLKLIESGAFRDQRGVDDFIRSNGRDTSGVISPVQAKMMLQQLENDGRVRVAAIEKAGGESPRLPDIDRAMKVANKAAADMLGIKNAYDVNNNLVLGETTAELTRQHVRLAEEAGKILVSRYRTDPSKAYDAVRDAQAAMQRQSSSEQNTNLPPARQDEGKPQNTPPTQAPASISPSGMYRAPDGTPVSSAQLIEYANRVKLSPEEIIKRRGLKPIGQPTR